MSGVGIENIKAIRDASLPIKQDITQVYSGSSRFAQVFQVFQGKVLQDDFESVYHSFKGDFQIVAILGKQQISGSKAITLEYQGINFGNDCSCRVCSFTYATEIGDGIKTLSVGVAVHANKFILAASTSQGIIATGIHDDVVTSFTVNRVRVMSAY